MNVFASFDFHVSDQAPLHFVREFDLPWVPTRGSYFNTEDFRWKVRWVEFTVDGTPSVEVHLQSMRASPEIWRVTACDLIEDGWNCELSFEEILDGKPAEPILRYLIENPINPAG